MKTQKTKRTGHITAIANQKGGVGKTTTAHALLTGLTAKGYKTLAVDIDPQSNLSYTMDADLTKPSVYELLKNVAKPQKIIQHTKQGDIITGSLMLTGADMEFTVTGREYLLKEVLEPVQTEYDYIIIDTPPTLGILTINALTAAADLVIPLRADAYSLQGFSQLYATIGTIKKRCNNDLKIAGLLVTLHNGRTALGRDAKELIEEKAQELKAHVYKTTIRESVAVREAQMEQANIYKAGTKNNAAADYLNFVNEYLKGTQK